MCEISCSGGQEQVHFLTVQSSEVEVSDPPEHLQLTSLSTELVDSLQNHKLATRLACSRCLY